MQREGLVSTACACASILQNLQNPNTYGYCILWACTFTDNFTAKYMENLAHTHAVDTRPSLRIIEGLGTRLGGERTPGIHCLHMHLISKISRKSTIF